MKFSKVAIIIEPSGFSGITIRDEVETPSEHKNRTLKKTNQGPRWGRSALYLPRGWTGIWKHRYHPLAASLGRQQGCLWPRPARPASGDASCCFTSKLTHTQASADLTQARPALSIRATHSLSKKQAEVPLRGFLFLSLQGHTRGIGKFPG